MLRKLALLGIALSLVACNSGPKPGDDVTPDQLAEYADVPIYPNGKIPDGLSRVPSKNEAGEMHYDLVMTTGEPPQVVANWYEKNTGLTAEGSNTNWGLSGITKKGNSVFISIFREQDYTKIVVSSIAPKRK